jgi:hypothetical protein
MTNKEMDVDIQVSSRPFANTLSKNDVARLSVLSLVSRSDDHNTSSSSNPSSKAKPGKSE